MTDVAPQLKGVVREAMARGARSITLAPGSPTVRVHLEPEREHISHLRVFVAHATADRTWADTVEAAFARIGFLTTYFPAGRVDVGASPEAITQSLIKGVTEADYLCLLFSKNSASRSWIQLEFAMAARLIGRVLMLRDSSVSTATEFSKPQFAFRALLTTRYQLLDYREDSASMLKTARILINHPEEGVTDGTFRPLSIRERDLKIESLRRKRMRLLLDEIPEYSARHVVDVLPFRWDELTFEGYKPSIDEVVERPTSVTTHFARISERLGVDLPPPERFVDLIGYAVLYMIRDADKAIELFRLNVSNYPGSSNVYDRLAEAYYGEG